MPVINPTESASQDSENTYASSQTLPLPTASQDVQMADEEQEQAVKKSREEDDELPSVAALGGATSASALGATSASAATAGGAQSAKATAPSPTLFRTLYPALFPKTSTDKPAHDRSKRARLTNNSQ